MTEKQNVFLIIWGVFAPLLVIFGAKHVLIATQSAALAVLYASFHILLSAIPIYVLWHTPNTK